jgi:diguanylate cyclase (GGDEF)-like protein
LASTGAWSGEIWNRRKCGTVFPEWLTITAVKTDAGEVTHYVSTLTDITQRKAAEEEIRHLAYYDPLTRLPNRRLLLDRLQQALANSVRSQRKGALLFIDLDHFKTLNDAHGHEKGDLLLQQTGVRLKDCIRGGDTVARLGGDEFVVMLKDLQTGDDAAAAQVKVVATKVLAALKQPYRLDNVEHHGSGSLGIALFGAQDDTVEELFKRADMALYEAKAMGRNALRFFDPAMQAAMAERASLEADLRRALQAGQFVLLYQPQVNAEGRFTGVEALVRWQHPTRGMVSPGQFIPLAESSGLIMPLGQWVLETACKQLAEWAESPKAAHLTVSVNVSARQFHQSDFVQEVLTALQHTGAPAHRLRMELTESMLVQDMDDIIAKMTRLKALGVGFSLDDFGTGYSSLAYLKLLPLDQLKIDQAFVRDLLTDPNDAAIAKTIVALGQSLGLSVMAEGVETLAQRDFLRKLGCTAYQGFFFGRPGTSDDIRRHVDTVPAPLGPISRRMDLEL